MISQLYQNSENSIKESTNLERRCKQINTNRMFCLICSDAEMMKVNRFYKWKEIWKSSSFDIQLLNSAFAFMPCL